MAAAVVMAAVSIAVADQARRAQNNGIDAQIAATEEAAAWNAAISRGDAEVARRSAFNIAVQGNRDMALKIAQYKQMKAGIKSGYATRGVAVNTGSALNQQEETLRAVSKDMNIIAYNAKVQMSKALNEADRYELMAEAGLMQASNQAHAYEEAASASAKNIMTQGYMNAFNSLVSAYNKGTFSGLFNNTSTATTITPGITAGTTSFMPSGAAAPTGYHWGAH